MALVLHRQPPFFTPPFFLALTAVESLVFGAMAAWAIRRRRATDWHRRLMIGATIVVLEPALGRLLPIPLLGVWAEPALTQCPLAGCAIAAAPTSRTRGAVHPGHEEGAPAVIGGR